MSYTRTGAGPVRVEPVPLPERAAIRVAVTSPVRPAFRRMRRSRVYTRYVQAGFAAVDRETGSP